MLRTALALAERNIAVFPCAVRSKIPATPRGCLDATTDCVTIQRWWHERPDCNVGCATGAISRLLVVDIDGAEHALRRLEEIHGALPASVEVITARGRHIWLRAEQKTKNTAGKLAPGLDTRGDGGYVLAPPSIHPSGRCYAWSVDSARAIAPAPAWLLDLLATPATNGAAPQPTPSSEWHELVANGVAEGARDCSVTKLAGYLLRRRADPIVVLELLQSWNATKCAPPLPSADIMRIVRSIAGKEVRRRGSDNG